VENAGRVIAALESVTSTSVLQRETGWLEAQCGGAAARLSKSDGRSDSNPTGWHMQQPPNAHFRSTRLLDCDTFVTLPALITPAFSAQLSLRFCDEMWGKRDGGVVMTDYECRRR